MAQEINFIRPQEVYDRNTGESKVRYRSYDGDNRFIPVLEGENGVPKTMVKVTHAELKTMRDGGKLTAGALYRITDYNCTTTQENTRSAGHQFDIVLLALSNNKLAEEGWAMMHDNIYDVTFADGVTKKCYIYEYTEGGYNVVEPDTLIGTSGEIGVEFVSIDDVNKVLICDPDYGPNSDGMENEGLTYNYFQNSNLSAWKVWYCLDNDKSRFAWADDSVDEDKPASISYNEKGTYVIQRNQEDDIVVSNVQYYAWGNVANRELFTLSATPQTGDTLYKPAYDGDEIVNLLDSGAEVETFTPAHEGTSKKESIKVYISAGDIASIGEHTLPAAKYQEGIPESIEIGGKTYYIWINNDEGVGAATLSRTPKEGDKIYYTNGNEIGYVISYQPENLVHNGRGVIYRLIDEFNNDIKYDFKNIQFVRKLTDGQYDADNGTETWCYTLNLWYNNMCQDASILGNTLPNDEGFVTGVYDNIFGYTTAYDLSIEGVNTFAFALGNNVVLSYEDGGYFGINSNTIGNNFYSNTIGNNFYSNMIENSFCDNTVGNSFFSNTIGNYFNRNTVRNEFNGNTVGNNFYNNKIGNNFHANIIGNNFFDKTISDNTGDKNYGNNGVELATKS